MSISLPFNLSYQATLITSVVTLFDPNPAFQYGQLNNGTYQILFGNQLNRDNGTASAGFPASDIPQVDLKGNTVYMPTTVSQPLPANSYYINLPSRVYGTPPANDTYSVLQINSALAHIEPGFSRLQVAYQYYDSNAGNFKNTTEYFDCPFYEGFNTTARELNNLVSYVEQGYAFLQKEIDILNQEVKYALSRELWRGTSVSGRITYISATEGLQTGSLTRSEFSHDFEEKTVVANPTMANLKSVAFGLGSTGIYSQTSPATELGSDTFTFQGAHSYPSLSYYLSEATDSNGVRCIVVVLGADWGNYAGQSSQSTLAYRFDFTSNGAVDKAIGSTSNEVYFHLVAKTQGTQNGQSVMQTAVATSTNNQFGAGMGQYTTKFDESLGNSFYIIQGPIWFFGPNNNSGAGVFSPTQSSTSNSIVEPGYTPMQSAVADTVSFSGQNYPRIVFYPDDNASTLTLNDITATFMTDDTYNNGGGNHGFSDQATLKVNTLLNLTPVVPPNGPVIDANNTPSVGCVGQTITVNGNYFNSTFDSAYVNGQPAPIVIVNQTQCKITIPSVPFGLTTLTITDGHHTPAQIPFSVLGQPLLNNITPSQSTPGSTVVISGNNFGAQDSGSKVSFGGTNATISSWNNTSISVVVPHGLSFGPTQVQVQNDCGEASSGQFSITNPDSVVISPHITTVSEGTSFQFDAMFFAGTNPGVDVSSGSATTWSVNGMVGGELVHGRITQAGLYTAPNSPPPDAITVTVQYFDNNTALFLSDSATVLLAAAPSIVISPANVQMGSGATQQFTVSLYVNNMLTDVTSGSTFEVNGTPGGDFVDGTITTGGLYTAPNNLTQNTNETITATYVYNSQSLTANAIATVAQAPSAFASITVTSQINVFLGDGRFGYVPVGTQLIAYPAQYVYVQFQELLDNKVQLPVSSYIPVQQLSMNAKNALDSDIANVIYNLADGSMQPDGTIQTLRTVVLGIIDPSDGRWHSMWDIGDPVEPTVNAGHDMKSLPFSSAGSIKAFDKPKNGFDGSLLDYINEMSGGAQTQLDNISAKNSVNVIGHCRFVDNTFEILDSLTVVGLDKDGNYGIIHTLEPQIVSVSNNQFVFVDEQGTLRVKNYNEISSEIDDVHSTIVGICLGKFHTKWNIMKNLDIDVSGMDEVDGKKNIKIGAMSIQMGTVDGISIDKKGMARGSIVFEKPYNKEYTPLLQLSDVGGGFVSCDVYDITLNGFSYRIGNTGTTKVSTKLKWLSIGV